MVKKKEKEFKEKILEKVEGSTISMDEISKCDRMLYGTFGIHDSEAPYSIISRKVAETKMNEFSLWGTGVKVKNIEKIRAFCETQNESDDVFLLLKYTDSDAQNQTGSLIEITDVKELQCKGGYFTSYIDGNGDKKHFEPGKILVKGKEKTQCTAFVVEKYLSLEHSFVRKDLLSKYKGVTDNSTKIKPAEKLFTLAPCYLLERKEKNIIETVDNGVKDRNAWGIVLKLKPPYIVRCDDYVKEFK